MVVACKSDPDEDLAVQPLEGNEIGAPFNIGLVELSIYMPQGKHKMRMSFGWLLKAISKERRVVRPPHSEVEEGPNENQARSNGAGTEQSHEWHHSVERKPLSDAAADSDLVIRRTQSQGAVRMLQNGSISSRLREQPPETRAFGSDDEKAPVHEVTDDGARDPDSQPASDLADQVAKDSEVGDPAAPVRREKPPPITVITTARTDVQKPP